MLRCPNCDYRSERIAAFSYANHPFSEEEGHGIYADQDEDVDLYLVCPDCARW